MAWGPALCAATLAIGLALPARALPALPAGQSWVVARAVQPLPAPPRAIGHCTIGTDTRPAVGCVKNLAPAAKVKTPRFAIGTPALLAGAIGLDPLSRDLGGEPVRLRVVARSGKVSRVLIDRVLDPADATGWTDYAAELRGGASSARLAFVAQPVGPMTLAHVAGPLATLPLFTAVRVHEPQPERPPANVLLLSIDTLRADHLGVYGCDLPTSPNIDRFAAGAALLEHAVSAYPSTTASHMTMLTGVYPMAHGVRGASQALSPDIPTLPEQLAAAGWSTAAVTEDAMVHGPSGFYRGFDWYREYKASYPSEFVKQVVGDGLGWLAAHRDERFFLFLHTYVVHDPFKPPEEFDVFSSPGPQQPETYNPDTDRRHYAGEVLYVDHEVRRLLDGLTALGLDDRTIVVITADHGHSFDWLHGFMGHGLTLAEEVLHVPLIVRAPGLVAAGTRLHATYSLADLTPTLLELLGVAPAAPMQGRSFAAKMRGGESVGAGRGAVFADLLVKDQWQQAVYLGARKWIVGQTSTSGPQLYDLANDSGERSNLFPSPLFAIGQGVVGAHARECEVFIERVRRRPAAPSVPNADTVKALRALGYVE